MRRSLLGTLILGLSFFGNAAMAAPVNLISNGDFETGTFAGWTVSTTNPDQSGGGCNQGWVVANVGIATGCLAVANPLGTYAAYQSFDGTGPKTRTLSQTFVVPTFGSAMLSFSQTYDFNVVLSNETPRTFDVNLTSASGTQNVFHFVSPTGFDTGITPWAQQSVDLTAALTGLAGQSVELAFVSTIPETFSGPAGFGLDNVRLEATPASSNVPEPSSLALIGLAAAGLGLVRRRR
jgi:hypothetical protein